MAMLSRRRALIGAGAMLGAGLTGWARAWAADQPFTPEKGAKLRLLRWRRFVQSEEDAFKRLVGAFTEATGVSVEVSSAPDAQVAMKANMAATGGAGPDLVWSIHADAHLYPDKLVDLSDVADHLGKKLGGWYPIAHDYGMHEGSWVCLPVALVGNYMTYRVSWLKQAGFAAFPTNLADFLRLAKQLKQDKHPMGLSLGPSVTDGNCWTHWLLWTFGGAVFDEKNRCTINSPETLQALEYARELYPHFVDGTLKWTAESNNTAFIAGQIGCTNNPVSIYAELLAARDPMAADTDHALFPIGPVGQPTELHIMRPMFLFKHARFPNAAKAFMTFMMEHPNYDDWLRSSAGYLSHTLMAYQSNPVWTDDPKRTVFREAAARCRSFAFKGQLGYAAAAILSDQIVLQMFAQAASGQRTPRDALANAEKRAGRYLTS
ncbi:MAG: extracellular solute-binding protein [Proteobacteria bacterium]|nr:extracellular solute-binding protein [Pseudomonadota bacterium]